MITAELNCNTGIDIHGKICGLTLLERTMLACYYAGIKKIEIISKTPDIPIPLSIQKLTDLEFRVITAEDKPFSKNFFSNGILKLNVSSVINREYVTSMTGGPDAPNKVYVELSVRQSRKKAVKDLLNSLRKPGEAFSSHYYRYLSLFFTRFLCRTPVTPNMITAFLVFVALAGGALLLSDKWYLYYTGLLMQVLALVFDCVDGEIARIKYKFSKNGDWIDSAGDNSCTLIFVAAIAIKNHHIHQNEVSFYLGIASVAIYVMAVVSLFLTLFATTSSGSLQTITREVQKKGKFVKFVTTMMKRNIVTPILVILGFLYFTQAILVLNIAAGLGLMIFSIVSMVKTARKRESEA